MTIPIPEKEYMEIVERALAEDIGKGDVTTSALGFGDLSAEARIRAKEDGIICGMAVAEAVFKKLDPEAIFEGFVYDGARVRAGDMLAKVAGKATALLSGERTALNFIQQLSGVSTLTFRFVRAVQGTKTVIKDTRKTSPGMRILEKYAVRCGGGANHRTGLFDGVMLKDNHIDFAGGIAEAVKRVRNSGVNMPVVVEVRNMNEVKDAIEAGAETIMLDNMSLKDIEEASREINGRAEVEVSGNVNLLNVTMIAEIGVDVISVGALTHSPDALDISMEIILPAIQNKMNI